MFTPMDNPRARADTTTYTNRLSKKSRGQPKAVSWASPSRAALFFFRSMGWFNSTVLSVSSITIPKRTVNLR
jgi:hypothetical protein